MTKNLSSMSLVALVVVLAASATLPRGHVEACEDNDEWRTYVVFERWARARRAAPQMHYTLTWTALDNSPFATEGAKIGPIFKGEVFLQWPDRLRVEFRNEAGVLSSSWVVKGRDARTYDFGRKVETNHLLPRNYRLLDAAEVCLARSRLDLRIAFYEASLWSTLGPPHRKLVRRFESRMTKIDAHWHYINLEPIRRWNWGDNEEWQVVLHKKEHWLRRVISAGAMVDFTKPDHQLLPPSTWEPVFEDLPKGWTSFDIDLSKSLAE